jgi:hypothetical protein
MGSGKKRRFFARKTLRDGQEQRACGEEKKSLGFSYKTESERIGILNVRW